MTQSPNTEAQHLLRKMLLFADSEISAAHPWLSEVDRWKELVFALLTRTTNLPQTTVRLLTDQMLHLQLLHVPALAGLLHGNPPRPDLEDSHSRRIIETLLDGGFTHEEAVKGLTVICQAAVALADRFSGKIQLYMRSYAQRMVNEARNTFKLSELSEDESRYAFTLWLQNVLGMPLSLDNETVEAFCRSNGVTAKQVFAAADELDVNVALVDDLLHHFHGLSEMTEVEQDPPAQIAGTSRRKKAKTHSTKK